jgi:hypothetical protein
MNQAILYPNFYEVTQSISLGRLVITIGIGYIYLVTDGSGAALKGGTNYVIHCLPAHTTVHNGLIQNPINGYVKSRKVFAGLSKRWLSRYILTVYNSSTPHLLL